jgi:phosphatidate cytidylyltransferase
MAPLALAAVWLGGWVFAALVIVAAGGMGREWARLTGCGVGPLGGLVLVAAALPAIAMALGDTRVAIVLVAAGAVAVGLASWRARCPAPDWTALGTAWIALPCLACIWLDRAAGAYAIMWLFLTV